MILSPSLLSADCGRLAETLAELRSAGVEWVHWDVMDGHFVPNMTFGQHVIKGLRKASDLFFDVHLMIEEPERYLADFQAAGAQMLVVHAEATRHLQRTLAEIRRLGMQAGVALNPATPLSALEYVLDDVDMVLLMSVNPGFGGQTFLPSTYAKLRRLRAMLDAAGRSGCLVQVDGGVDVENTPALVAAGASVLVSGSAFFKKPPYAERLRAFTEAAASAGRGDAGAQGVLIA
ncbi:MAG: ribulose-phosphate 3-epimerase [Desulfovibrio sp.]|jgi:ribulose-phosphate 3-epimerase